MSFLSNTLLLVVTLFCSLNAISQVVVEQRTVHLTADKVRSINLSTSADLHAFVAKWATGTKPTSISYRYTERNNQFGEWQTWSLANEKPSVKASQLLTVPGYAKRLEIKVKGGHNVKVKSTSYAKDAPRGAQPGISALAASACPCPAPAVTTRQTWCPTGDCQPANTPTPLTPEFMIVHHSGTNLDDVDYALVVRAIYDYHTGTNGWDDIGYNLLVAPDGTVYEGRGTSTQGAHFCGANSGTLGICLLGNYETTAVPSAAVNALNNLGSFLSCEYNIEPFAEMMHEPSGKTLNGLAGHRDGCSTSCPGDQLYSLLPTLRSAIDNRTAAGCVAIAAPSNLSASNLNDGAVGLSWTAYAGAEQVLIERSTNDPNNFQLFATAAGDAARFTDIDAPSGTNFYRIRVITDGLLSPYSNEVTLAVSSSEAAPSVVQPRLVRNPVRGRIEIAGLTAKVDQAFVSDLSGRTLLELKGTTPRWDVRPGKLANGRYWVIIFSGNEWFTVPFEYLP